jgi:hypothetical protein
MGCARVLPSTAIRRLQQVALASVIFSANMRLGVGTQCGEFVSGVPPSPASPLARTDAVARLPITLYLEARPPFLLPPRKSSYNPTDRVSSQPTLASHPSSLWPMYHKNSSSEAVQKLLPKRNIAFVTGAGTSTSCDSTFVLFPSSKKSRQRKKNVVEETPKGLLYTPSSRLSIFKRPICNLEREVVIWRQGGL